MATVSPFVPKVAPDPFADRSAPYSAEAELAVLGGMLIDGDALTRAIEVVDDTMFYREGNRRAFRAMRKIFERGDVIDPVTLAEELRGAGDLEAVGGLQFIASVLDAVPTAANIEYHAKIVREKAVLRRLIEASTVTIQETYAHQGDIDELLDKAESRIFQIAQTHERKGFVWIKELLWPAMERIELLSQNSSAVTGVPTGFYDLDEMTAGFQKGDLIIVAARPSMGKCLSHDSEIVLEDGSVVTIEEIYRRREARLLTLGADWKLGMTEPSAFVDDGEKPVFRVTTRLGRQIETTLTHPFLTVDGWKPLGEVSPGDHVAVPRQIPVFGTGEMRECEVKLLAYLIGDGGLTGTNPRFTNADPRVRAEFSEAVAEFGGLTVTLEDSRGTRTPYLSVRRDAEVTRAARAEFAGAVAQALPRARGEGVRLAAAAGVSRASVSHWINGMAVPAPAQRPALGAALGIEFAADPRIDRNPLVAWLDGLGAWGKGAADKTVPAPVFTLRREGVALFLNRLFATDGWATVLASGQAQIGYATVSERLARQVQHLLLRFGIVTSLRRRMVKYGGGRRPAWQIDVTDARSLRTFAREIGIFGKAAAVERVERAIEEKRYQTNRDLVPRQVWDRLAEAKGDESWASLARRAGIRGWTNLHAGRRALSRDRLAVLARALGNAELIALAESDVYWDEIVSIEPLGMKQVYDLTVPGTHNFVSNDVCVHNTAFTLNIAQHAAIAEGKCVAFFSLEMSKDSLVQRLLTSEARVDAGRVRTGRLRDDDYPRLAQAAGLLNTAPIFIDDTPGISVLEMRAKARRLKSDRDDLSMIIVDYLQLMQGNTKSENRQQEVSEISRGLKALAKELEVPVVALSQLSRAVESRPDKRPMMSDLRECVTGDTLVVLADGRRVAIRELVGTAPDVVSVDEAGRLVIATSELVWSVGRKPVFGVHLECGRQIRATAEHRLRGPAGWVHVSEIAPGDRLAVERAAAAMPSDQRFAPRAMAVMSDGAPSRAVVAEYATLLEDDGLREWAESDLFWDRVVAVVPEGEEEVFDLTVPGTACWLADGIVSHNSGAIEQDADVIMFLYRPEYYYGPTDKDGNSLEGLAEVVIGKQRNGATGTVRMQFIKEFTRFENFTRRADEGGGYGG